MPRAKTGSNGQHTTLCFFCPGCDTVHMIPVTGPNAWDWNGSFDAPTTNPSILVRSYLCGPDRVPMHKYEGPYPCERHPSICHSYLKDGRIQYLSDCTHALAGQTIDLTESEEAP